MSQLSLLLNLMHPCSIKVLLSFCPYKSKAKCISSWRFLWMTRPVCVGCVCGFVCSVVKFGSVIPVRIFMPAAAESHVHCNWRTLENGRPRSRCFSIFQTCLVTFTALRSSHTHSCNCALLCSLQLILSHILHVPDISLLSSSPLRSP